MAFSVRAVLVVVALAGLAGCTQPVPVTASSGTGAAMPPSAPAILVGATPAVLSAEFGQPALRHTEGSSEVWLYRSERCGLNLFLFPDGSGMPRVATALSDSGDATSCAATLPRAAGTPALTRTATLPEDVSQTFGDATSGHRGLEHASST